MKAYLVLFLAMGCQSFSQSPPEDSTALFLVESGLQDPQTPPHSETEAPSSRQGRFLGNLRSWFSGLAGRDTTKVSVNSGSPAGYPVFIQQPSQPIVQPVVQPIVLSAQSPSTSVQSVLVVPHSSATTQTEKVGSGLGWNLFGWNLFSSPNEKDPPSWSPFSSTDKNNGIGSGVGWNLFAGTDKSEYPSVDSGWTLFSGPKEESLKPAVVVVESRPAPAPAVTTRVIFRRDSAGTKGPRDSTSQDLYSLASVSRDKYPYSRQPWRNVIYGDTTSSGKVSIAYDDLLYTPGCTQC